MDDFFLKIFKRFLETMESEFLSLSFQSHDVEKGILAQKASCENRDQRAIEKPHKLDTNFSRYWNLKSDRCW